jgi:hypothetical protein
VGQEVRCNATIEGKASHGRALLETDDLVFRGDVRVSIPYRDITSLATHQGVLTVGYPGGTADFELGAYAEQWADRIRNPKTVLDKLGIKAGQTIALIDVHDTEFRDRLVERGVTLRQGRPGSDCDMIFLGAETIEALRKLPSLVAHLAPTGAIWVLRPKGHARITERAVMTAGRESGLVDTKVVRFSETHTAEKFVIPRAKR